MGMAHPYKSSRVLARAIVAELNEVPIGVHGHLIKPAETGPASVTWPDCHAEFVQYIEDKWPALSDQASLTAAFIEKFCVEGSVVDQSNARPATLDTGRYGVGVLYPLRLCFSLYSADDKQAYRCVEEAPLIASYLGPTPRPGGLFELVHEPILVDSDLGPGTEVVVLTAIMAALEIGLPAGITWAVDHETVLLPTDLGSDNKRTVPG